MGVLHTYVTLQWLIHNPTMAHTVIELIKLGEPIMFKIYLLFVPELPK